uniref:Uncharacterized protein n=1 Tax=Ditylenchus dipsaci TaxID=166011 RepID=A0A915DVM3_9BILA
MDSRRFTGDPAPLHTTSSLTALPERVTELFHSMLDGEHFFRSPFIRHKIVVPNLLFSNGKYYGLDPIFTSDSPSSSSTDGSSHSPGGGPTPMHIPPPAPSTRHTNSKLVVVRNIPIRLMATATTAQDNKPSGANSNNVSSSTTIDFSSKPISSSLLKNVLQNRHPSESEESDSPSLRSAPPELLHQRNNKEVEEEGENSISSNIRNNRRKLSTPKDLFSHSSMLSLRGQPQQQQQQYTTTGQQYQQQQQNPSLAKSHSPRQLSDELSAPSIQRRHFSWQQPQRNQHNDSRSNSMDQEDESLQKRLQETKNNERNSNSSTPVNFRSVPIVQLNSSQNQKENSFGNAVQLDYNSNNNNNNASWQQSQQRSSTPAAGDTSLENSKAYYSAIPFRRPPSTTRELSDGIHSTATMTSAISSPSLLTGKPAISFIKRQQTPSKRAFYQSNEAERLEQQQTTPPSFLRRTQTVYTIPSGNLPRRDSEPSVIIDASNNNNHLTAESAHSGAHSNRRSLHETSLQQQQPSDAHSAHPPSRSKSPSMASLRQSLKSFSTKPKKITFVPSCVRGNQQASSDEEDHQARNRMEEEASARLARSRSPSITASSLRLTEFVPNEEDLVRNATFTPKHKKEDSVEEAIRSLESFDPNDYYVRTNHKNERDHTGAPHYPINTNSSSYYIRQPNITSSDDESLPPPPPLPILTSTRYLSQQQPTIQERHWNTTTPTRFTTIKGIVKNKMTSRHLMASGIIQPPPRPPPIVSKTPPPSNLYKLVTGKQTITTDPLQTTSAATKQNQQLQFFGGTTPTGPQSTADLSFNRSFENRTPRATTPTSIISPTAMGNSNGVVYIGPPAVHNHQRNSTSTPNTNHYQPPSNVPFEMDQLLNRLKMTEKCSNPY